MVRIPRRLYHQALASLLYSCGYTVLQASTGMFLVKKKGRTLFMGMLGKNLPYSQKANEQLLWDVQVKPDRLEGIRAEAQLYKAEEWLAFCYLILSDNYKHFFDYQVMLQGNLFGARFVSVEEYLGFTGTAEAFSVDEMLRRTSSVDKI